MLKKEVLQEYFNNRKNLITKIVQENHSDLSLILGDLPITIGKNEFFKEKENVVLYFNYIDYDNLFHNDFEGKYRLDEKILNDNRFIEKFVGSYSGVEKSLRLVTCNELLIQKMLTEVKLYSNMKNRIVNSLRNTEREFITYLEILMNSGIFVYEIEFLKDMIDVVFSIKESKKYFLNIKIVILKK